MAELTQDERRAVAGLLGVAAHTVGHFWEQEGPQCSVVLDALGVASLIGWTAEDMEALWAIAIELCQMGALDA